ncbi:phosphodiester glycosidase family protein [Pedobacter sp. LMG 31464]|uniref:Phosphodiester glycosidase family protein n=1 Tax=Pedobacter planticolens TaxID=2679964 RepID=A0A923E028_9SPHI|nr:phosphodiester glycosidase family protein [Pedobacter planticolens]MBB2146245.1 phosphodiester glycosidase family protein [Pedobacter planticolens]
MLKKTLFLLFITFSNLAFAQNVDSITLVNAKWHKQRVAPKTKLITYHFDQKNLFLANQNISYVEVKNKGNSPVFEISASPKELKTTPTFGKENAAFAAINGTFFDVKNGGSVDFVKVNGQVINSTKLEKNNSRARHQKAALVIENGKLALKKWDNTSNWEENLTEKNVMLSGPLLIFNQLDEALDTSAFNRLRHPRSAIGIKPNGKIILLTVDGRQENSAGVSLFELTKVMRWLGCTSAINLDGGGSTTLWVSKAPENGIVNYPSDNKKWDHEGARKVANVILLKKKQ